MTIDAMRQADGVWREGVYLPQRGNSTMTVTALISDFDGRRAAGPMAIVDPTVPPLTP